MDQDKQPHQSSVPELLKKLEEQETLLAQQERTIARLEKELEEMLNSKVWRLAEFFRRIVRVHIFNWFPSLQITIIPGLKRRFRAHIFLPLVKIGLCKDEYSRWVEIEQKGLLENKENIIEVINSFAIKPTISLVMPVYNVRIDWLRQAVESVNNQLYTNWQLCIADDCSTDLELKKIISEYTQKDSRIKSCFLDQNVGISRASNAALGLVEGDFVGLLDNDDELAPDALFEVVKAINKDPQVDFIYSDEDKITESGQRYDAFFKPDWSPETLRSYNYICHFSIIRRTLIEQVGGFREGYDGSQDYDLFLRATEQARSICHIPKILYHWRAIEGSVGKRGDAKMYAYDSAKKALGEHLDRVGIKGQVGDGLFLGSYRIHHQDDHQPEIAIIIPTKDQVEVLTRCISSIAGKTTYTNYKIIIVDNGSMEQATFEYYETLKTNPRVSILEYQHPFNFSAINNFAVAHVESEYLLFLNNDTEVIAQDWLEGMAGNLQQDDVGAVGSLLYYPNDTVQHGGIIVGIGGVAGHSHKYFSRNEYGYFGRLKVVQNLSAVTAACLMTRRSVFQEVGGFEEYLSHAFNDLDLCLKIREKGYRIVYTPFAELYHHESISRGYENTPEKKQRFKRERDFCEDRWGKILQQGDPYYNPHLSLTREDFSICPDALKKEIANSIKL